MGLYEYMENIYGDSATIYETENGAKIVINEGEPGEEIRLNGFRSGDDATDFLYRRGWRF